MIQVKFIYSEKATNFYEISTVDLSYVVMVKSTVKISQNCVAFSEYINFTNKQLLTFTIAILNRFEFEVSHSILSTTLATDKK